MPALLNIRDLEISFRNGKKLTPAVSGVSFDVRAGEIMTLVGESGSGKSVTALSILGLLARQAKITGGQVLFEGKDLLRMTEQQLDAVRGREISMIFQDIMYSLNPVLTIGSQMMEGMRRHLGYTKEQAQKESVRLLQRTGIRDAESMMKKYPHMCSGGQRQRVMIAMAQSCKPKLLIADEPTTALDVTIQCQIMELLRSLREETGMAVLLITHDIGIVAEMADRVAVMYAGQCVEEADAETLLTRPAHAYTKALMQAAPGLHDDKARRLYAIPGFVPQVYGDMKGCRFAPRCPHGQDCPWKEDGSMAEIAPGHLSRCRWGEGGNAV